MSVYRKTWDCCGDTTETDAWEPEHCPFCRAQQAQTAPVEPIMCGDIPVERVQLDAACFYLKEETVFDGMGILEAWNKLVQFYVAHRAAPVSAVNVPEGFKLAPIEPTKEMLDAAATASMQHLLDCIKDPKKANEVGSEENVRKTHAARYRSMLSAAPAAPVESKDKQDAARWRALLNSARIRPLGSAGIKSAEPNNYAHLGLELWTVFGNDLNSEWSERLANENAVGRETNVARRAEQMPDDFSALRALMDVYLRFKEMGWNDAVYCPKDGTPFEVIETGSTGIHKCIYMGEWPKGGWWIMDGGDLFPSRPILFRKIQSDTAQQKDKGGETA